MDRNFDVVIAGGGPVGALLALSLRESQLAVLRVDHAQAGSERPIVLSAGSRLLLEPLGVFSNLAVTPVRSIHVSQRGTLGRVLICADDYRLPALGYVSPYNAIRAAMDARLEGALAGQLTAWSTAASGITLRVALHDGEEQEFHTRLLVLADGGGPGSGAHLSGSVDPAYRDYRQDALVAQLRTEIPHNNVAYERFLPDGPLALLPSSNGFSLVWCLPRGAGPALCAIEEQDFLARIGSAFGTRLGRFLEVSARHSVMLVLRYHKTPATPGVIAIGNAAQSLHPVAGQGLNLGLRDAWELGAAILDAGEARNRPEFATDYERRRRNDRRAGIAMTDALARVFTLDSGLARAARGGALFAIDTLPGARSLLADLMMYGLRRSR